MKPEFDPGGGQTCFLSEAAASVNAARMKSVLQGQAFPAQANPKVLVIRVDFSDLAMSLTKSQTESFFSKVRDFYFENSYGVFYPTFTVSNTVHTLGTLATYGADCGSDIACKDLVLRIAAVAAEDNTGQNFSQFDQVMIYHAGDGQESSGQGNDIWSVYFPGGFTVDGKIFDGFTVVPEAEAGNVDPLGVICHEYGHQLGLPDLYDVSVAGGASTVGVWDVMDYPYSAASGNPLGSNPSHLGAWSKMFLGFTTPASLTSGGLKTLFSIDVSSQSYSMPVVVSDVGPSNEFFLAEYRNISSTATYDKGIPASGILIWHIDQTIASDPTHLTNNDVNSPALSGASHRGVDVVEADFTQSYSGSHGEATDIFTSASSFLPPLSDAFNGVPSGMLITGISGISTAQAQFTFDTPTVSTFSLNSAIAFSTTIAANAGFVTVALPPGTFPNGTDLYVAAISTTSFSALGADSFVGEYEASLVGCLVSAGANIQPSLPIQLTVGFSGDPALAALSAQELNRLTLARYDAAAQSWVPYPSKVDTTALTISASLNHLSLIQIMKASPASSTSEVKVYPNPMRPSLGATYSVINFSNLPARSMVKIFSLSGEMITQVTANDSGYVVWDGRNEKGQPAASGVYFALLEDESEGQKKISKVAIER